jgi:predicted lipoprotein with Yx(FWY)xxD motif
VTRTIALCTAALAAALMTAGCGSSGSSTTTSATSSTAASTPAQSTATQSAASTTAAGGGELISTKNAKLGTVLMAGPKKLTVYLFEADKGPASTCSGACAQIWPPVTSSGAPRPGGAAKAADLATITRSDGSKQVTYKGHPLYYYIKDKDNGDAYGQGSNSFGAAWYVLAPSGNKIDKS